jgi:hypothetical protein
MHITRPTHGQLFSERTAAVVWDVLAQVRSPVFLWNVFPLHPHEASDPFSNRAHNATERVVGEDLLAALLDLLQPQRLIAIGNDATKSVRRVGGDSRVVSVRHPSYGGHIEFLAKVRTLYHVSQHTESSEQLGLL